MKTETITKTSAALNYLITHWQGKQSLRRSYWVNTLAINLLLNFMLLVTQAAFNVPHEAVSIFLTMTLIIAIWQFVGLWRSASKKGFWGIVTKFLVIVGWITFGFACYAIFGNFTM